MTKSATEPNNLPRACGQRLRQLREQLQLTQSELAERAHLGVPYISQIENGHRDPSLTSLGALADALGVSLAEFFSLEGHAASDAGADAVPEAVAAEVRRLPPAQARLALDIVRLLARASSPLASAEGAPADGSK